MPILLTIIATMACVIVANCTFTESQIYKTKYFISFIILSAMQISLAVYFSLYVTTVFFIFFIVILEESFRSVSITLSNNESAVSHGLRFGFLEAGVMLAFLSLKNWSEVSYAYQFEKEELISYIIENSQIAYIFLFVYFLYRVPAILAHITFSFIFIKSENKIIGFIIAAFAHVSYNFLVL